MADAVLTALIAAVTALITALIATYGSLKRERRAEAAAQRARIEDKATALERILARYRDPLLSAAFDLQSRIYNICRQGFLYVYLENGNDSQRRYAEFHTLFVIAEFCGWFEVIRREVQFLDLQEVDKTRQVRDLLDAIATAFLSDDPSLGVHFMVFRGEQRAIGELVMRRQVDARNSGREHDCIGYAEFVSNMAAPEFAAWFNELRQDLAAEGERPTVSPRLVRVQHALVGLIEALDPNAMRYARSHLQRL